MLREHEPGSSRTPEHREEYRTYGGAAASGQDVMYVAQAALDRTRVRSGTISPLKVAEPERAIAALTQRTRRDRRSPSNRIAGPGSRAVYRHAAELVSVHERIELPEEQSLFEQQGVSPLDAWDTGPAWLNPRRAKRLPHPSTAPAFMPRSHTYKLSRWLSTLTTSQASNQGDFAGWREAAWRTAERFGEGGGEPSSNGGDRVRHVALRTERW